jgi:hypothetical protein
MNKLLKAFLILVVIFVFDTFMSWFVIPVVAPITFLLIIILTLFESLFYVNFFPLIYFITIMTLFICLIITLHNWWLERKAMKGDN